MVGGPRPRFIALPEPASIRPDPGTDTVGPPTSYDVRWMPDATIGTNGDPGTEGRQGSIEIGNGMDLHSDTELD